MGEEVSPAEIKVDATGETETSNTVSTSHGNAVAINGDSVKYSITTTESAHNSVCANHASWFLKQSCSLV